MTVDLTEGDFTAGVKTITGNVNITGNTSGTITLPAGLTITGDLTVNTPKSTVNNSSTVQGIINIKDVAVGTWNENADNNKIVVNVTTEDKVIKVNVEDNKTVASLQLESPTTVNIPATAKVATPIKINAPSTLVSPRENRTIIKADTVLKVKEKDTDNNEEEITGNGKEAVVTQYGALRAKKVEASHTGGFDKLEVTFDRYISRKEIDSFYGGEKANINRSIDNGEYKKVSTGRNGQIPEGTFWYDIGEDEEKVTVFLANKIIPVVSTSSKQIVKYQVEIAKVNAESNEISVDAKVEEISNDVSVKNITIKKKIVTLDGDNKGSVVLPAGTELDEKLKDDIIVETTNDKALVTIRRNYSIDDQWIVRVTAEDRVKIAEYIINITVAEALKVYNVSADNDTQVVTVELNRPFVDGDKEVTIEDYTLDEPAVGKTELVFNPDNKVKNDTTESKDVVVKVLLDGEEADTVKIVVAGESQRLVNGLKGLDADKLGFLSTRVHVGKKDSVDTAEVVINKASLIKAYTVENLTAEQLDPGLDFNTNNVSKNRLVVFEDLVVDTDGFNLILTKEGDDLVLGSETKMSKTLFEAIKAQDGAKDDNKYNITITKGFNATAGSPGAKDKIAKIVFSLEEGKVVVRLEA